MIMSHHSIGLIRPGIAIRPAILHPLPPASDIVQADDQDGHGHHAGHQVHRPVFVPSLRRTWLLARSISGETLAAQVLWGSWEHGLPPVLMRQRVLVAHGAAWWAGIWLVSILVVRRVGLCHPRLLLVVSGLPGGRSVLASRRWFCIRTLGTVFQVPAGGRPIDGPLMEHFIGTTLVRKANRRGSQRVIGELLLGGLSRGMLGDLFFEPSHRYPSYSLTCCMGIVLPACRGACPSLPPPTASRFCCTSWVRCQRRCCCAIAWPFKPRVRSRMEGLHCCSSLASFSSHITTRLHWRLASVRSSIACPYQRAALRVRHWQ